MMNIADNSATKPPSTEKIKKFEDGMRVKLPDSFIEFLHSNNGAKLIDATFMLNGQERLIERFLCLVDNTKEDPKFGPYDMAVVATQLDDRLAIDGDQLGLTIIPFAALFAGDFLCFDYRDGKTDNPAVVVWDHEKSDELAPFVEYLSDSFESLLKLLG